MWQVFQQLADQFCVWYDELDPSEFHRHVEEWTADRGLLALAAAIERDAERAPSIASPRMRVDNGDGDRQGRIFAALRGLDRVFERVVPTYAGVPSETWAQAAVDVAIHGRLDSGIHGGMLLPRLVTRNRPGRLPDEPREAFAAVVRVPPEACAAIKHTFVPIASRFHRRDFARGLTIGCAPLVQDPDELRFETRLGEAGRFYRIAPRDERVIAARIDAVLERFVAAGVQIGIAPELTLSPDLLDAWRAALRKRRRKLGRLRLLVPGTGDIDASDGRPVNATELLDARTGASLGRHDKLFPFALDAACLERMGLVDRLGAEPIDEDLVRGEHLTLFDLGGMRVAILICEDLKRVEDHAARLRDFGVSHVLVPVFARSLKDRRWERNSAEVIAAAGAKVVVANSLVVPSLTGVADAATGLLLGPGMEQALLLQASAPDDIAVVTLHADGTASAGSSTGGPSPERR